MLLSPTRLPGVMLVDVALHSDERGGFARTYDQTLFADQDLPTHWPQCNVSWNPHRGTLRGLHYQIAPHPEPKLVRCTRGAIFDVAVDLRPDSPTYCQWFGVELNADNRRALYVPPGCAHGFLSLLPDTEVFYQMGDVYRPDLARTVRWNDPAFAIAWPFAPSLMAGRDADCPDFRP